MSIEQQTFAYTTTSTPWGRVGLLASPVGLAALGFEAQRNDTGSWAVSVATRLADLATQVQEVPNNPTLVSAIEQLREYWEGTRQEFALPLDRRLSHGFGLAVHKQLEQIGYGHTASYAEVARAVGNPQAVRAVGSACGANPLPIIVPCHRVLRSDGSLGGYAGGLHVKRLLLDLEARHSGR